MRLLQFLLHRVALDDVGLTELEAVVDDTVCVEILYHLLHMVDP